jgi:hypothetical protein
MSSSGRWKWKSETSTGLDYRREFDGGLCMRDSQDLTLHTTLSDGVAPVRP